MEDFELTLFDRIEVIKTTNEQYDLENKGYISFSGGKDSTVLHYLIDMALPGNKIPRVFINTGIEYVDIVKFVRELAKEDDRFVIINPTKPVLKILQEYGYPFKSKEHSTYLRVYQNSGETKTIVNYLGKGDKKQFLCPKLLHYQFTPEFNIKVSEKCCVKLKKEPVHKWGKENNRPITITGMRNDEGGLRAIKNGCAIFSGKDLVKFHPLKVVSNEWEDWFIKEQKIKLCRLYYPPFNFNRTGCKGCPFSLDLQEQLDIMKKYLPNEEKQCEMIWKPIYAEYRRINYRLKNKEQLKLF